MFRFGNGFVNYLIVLFIFVLFILKLFYWLHSNLELVTFCGNSFSFESSSPYLFFFILKSFLSDYYHSHSFSFYVPNVFFFYLLPLALFHHCLLDLSLRTH